MSSDVAICNLALSHLMIGKTINSILPVEESKESEVCSIHFPFARDTVLAMHEWLFATRDLKLAQIGTAPEEWEYQYQAPNNMISAISVHFTGNEIPQQFIVQNNETHGLVILTNVNEAYFKYIHRITNYNIYAPQATIAISWLLAAFIAGPLGKSNQDRQNAMDEFRVIMGPFSSAVSRDGMNCDVDNPIGGRQDKKNYIPGPIQARL